MFQYTPIFDIDFKSISYMQALVHFCKQREYMSELSSDVVALHLPCLND